MEQLPLTSFEKRNDQSFLKSSKPYHNILLQWTCRYPDFDEERQIEMMWNVEVRLKEAVITKNKKRIPGFQLLVIVRITDRTGEMEIDSFIHADEPFEQNHRLKAIKEYSNWCAMVWFQWKTVGESRSRVLPVLGDKAHICPFCGFAAKEFFDGCTGCGKRFWRVDAW